MYTHFPLSWAERVNVSRRVRRAVPKLAAAPRWSLVTEVAELL